MSSEPILATTNTISSTLESDQASSPEGANLTGTLEDLTQPLFTTTVSVHRLAVPFASFLTKLVTSYGALNGDVEAYLTPESSVMELLSQTLPTPSRAPTAARFFSSQ